MMKKIDSVKTMKILDKIMKMCRTEKYLLFNKYKMFKTCAKTYEKMVFTQS